jgi:hypothetical protein
MRTLNVSFTEVQRIDQWWLRALLLVVLAILIYPAIRYMQTTVDKLELFAFCIGLLIGLAVIALIWFWKLTTVINNYGIAIKCPFVNKKVNWEEIEHLEVLNYGFVGGWGIRVATKYGTVYNTSGKIGLAIKLKNGKKFLLGTQKENELKTIVEKWKNI